jgi:hypothetical protein
MTIVVSTARRLQWLAAHPFRDFSGRRPPFGWTILHSHCPEPWLTDKSEACPATLLSSVYTLFGTTGFQGG